MSLPTLRKQLAEIQQLLRARTASGLLVLDLVLVPRLRELREVAGLTQQQLAETAGLTREGVAQLETGRREPAWRTVVALCQALDVSYDAFMQVGEAAQRPPGRPRKAEDKPCSSSTTSRGPAGAGQDQEGEGPAANRPTAATEQAKGQDDTETEGRMIFPR
jgi:transcriptional regulator with XRE-family HTH domain